MKIHSKLLFDEHSNKLISFVDLDKEEQNLSSGLSDLATHDLVFFIHGAASNLVRMSWHTSLPKMSVPTR